MSWWASDKVEVYPQGKNFIEQEKYNLGLSVGTQYVGCPTCADAAALVHVNSVDMQTAI